MEKAGRPATEKQMQDKSHQARGTPRVYRERPSYRP